jgi:hypothetical protein
VSNATFGTLTAGRQYAFSNDLVNAYDPTGGSYGFSLIGNSSTLGGGGGETETARYNTSVKYLVTCNGFRAGGLAQIGGWSEGNGTREAYQAGGRRRRLRRLISRRGLRIRQGRREPRRLGHEDVSAHVRHAEGDPRRPQCRHRRHEVQVAAVYALWRL